MKPFRLVLSLAAALAAFAAGGGQPPARADATCAHTDAVFYSMDSQTLAQQLGAAPSACADYWVSVGPYTGAVNTGKPKFLPAGPVIHQQGPQFHVLAEIRLKSWCAAAAASGWYETGQMLHDWMLKEGFDPARDAWAVNEVGVPSDDPCQEAVLGDVGARRAFQQFVHGLYDGYPGETPIAGVVFAASPAQLAAPSDVAGYRTGLAGWLADAPFWEDMGRYVRFWGQEAYADSRAWAVAGATADDRGAFLNDYFMHARRLAAAGSAARAFLARAYTPIGNASWKQPAPPTQIGPGYGETDTLTAAEMKGFISAQVSALRSWIGTRFGFAVVPKNAGADRAPLEAHLGAAIRASESDPAGACSIAPCDAATGGAAFADAWQTFAAPPVIVPAVVGDRHPDGWYAGDVGVSWSIDSMDSPLTSSGGCEPRTVVEDTAGSTFTCTATNRGGSSSASVAVLRDTTPPVILPHVTGPKSGDWYTGDVTVDWEVSDSLSPILATSGCGPAIVTQDTGGVTFACTATSDGGTTTRSVTIARDATPPTIACSATPAVLWPPNGELVPVVVAVDVADATSGAAGFALTDAPTAGAADFVVGTPDVSGALVAERPGNGGDLVYTLTYTGRDTAGNTATCAASVTVPHDRRGRR